MLHCARALLPCLMFSCLTAWAQPAPPAADKLLDQLGSRKWTEREAAAAGLLALGEAVLPALKAYKAQDAEVRRRIETLIVTITGRAELKRATLAPPVRRALGDFFRTAPRASVLLMEMLDGRETPPKPLANIGVSLRLECLTGPAKGSTMPLQLTSDEKGIALAELLPGSYAIVSRSPMIPGDNGDLMHRCVHRWQLGNTLVVKRSRWVLAKLVFAPRVQWLPQSGVRVLPASRGNAVTWKAFPGAIRYGVVLCRQQGLTSITIASAKTKQCAMDWKPILTDAGKRPPAGTYFWSITAIGPKGRLQTSNSAHFALKHQQKK